MKKSLYLIVFLGTFLGCSKTENTPVIPKPIADFTWTEVNGTVQFTNTSKNADSHQWDFGDNLGKSTSQNPSYKYEYKGIYQVKLISKNTVGESDAINTINISTGKDPKPISNFSIKDLGKGDFQFTNTSQYADTYSWDFGDGSLPILTKDATHQFYSNGLFKVTLTATGKGGKESKIQEIEAKNVPDNRDLYVGSWIRTYRLEGINKEYTNTITITKSNLKTNEILLKIIGKGLDDYSDNATWIADVQGNIIQYTNQETGYLGSISAGKGTLSADSKTIIINGKYNYNGCCSTKKIYNTTELWAKQ